MSQTPAAGRRARPKGAGVRSGNINPRSPCVSSCVSSCQRRLTSGRARRLCSTGGDLAACDASVRRHDKPGRCGGASTWLERTPGPGTMPRRHALESSRPIQRHGFVADHPTLEVKSEALPRPDHRKVERNREQAAREERPLEAKTLPQQRGDEQEHRQRRKHVPECCARVGSHVRGIGFVTP